MDNNENSSLLLCDLSDESLDTLIALPANAKVVYFSTLISKYYPTISENTDEWKDLLDSYASSLYVEKLYRSNRFFNEMFTVVYTDTGQIRDIVNELYFNQEDLVVH